MSIKLCWTCWFSLIRNCVQLWLMSSPEFSLIHHEKLHHHEAFSAALAQYHWVSKWQPRNRTTLTVFTACKHGQCELRQHGRCSWSVGSQQGNISSAEEEQRSKKPLKMFRLTGCEHIVIKLPQPLLSPLPPTVSLQLATLVCFECGDWRIFSFWLCLFSRSCLCALHDTDVWHRSNRKGAECVLLTFAAGFLSRLDIWSV